MKRKLEDTDDGFFENPSKVLPTAMGLCSGNIVGNMVYQVVGTSAEQIGRPRLASTPQGFTDAGGRQRPHSTAHRISATTTLQSSPAADNELRHVIDNFVSVYEQLDKNDDADVKPNYSYSELAYLAMLRSPNFCLPIGQIYSYIQSRFKFFRNSTRKHWKNAVRHSLAKTLCFSKIQVGRGASNNEKLARSTYLWCILPNSIACFARGDYRATIDKETGTNTLRSAYFRMNSEPFWNSVGDYIANKMTIFRKTLAESQSPGLIFESQTCSFPWKQENMQAPNWLPKRREVFQIVQNQPKVTMNMQHGNCGFSPSPSEQSPGYYVTHSPEVSPQPLHSQISPNLHMYQAHARSSSPALRMPEAQLQNQSALHQTTPSRVADPWVSEIAFKSPEQNFIPSELDQRTPSCTSFEFADSGYGDSFGNENSCKFLNSCNKQSHDELVTSPLNVHNSYPPHHLSNDAYDFNQFDLSPFTLSDFSDEINQSRFTPEKATGSPMLTQNSHISRRPLFISTPVPNQMSPGSQCRYMYQNAVHPSGFEHKQTPASPVMFAHGDGMFSTGMAPHWSSFC